MSEPQRKGTSLVVDDDPAMCEIVKDVLQRLGYEVFTAETSEEGLKLAMEHSPDMSILDLVLPDFSGIELLGRMRRELLMDSPILMMTGQGSVISAVKAMKAGATDYLQKPFSTEALREAIVAIEELIPDRPVDEAPEWADRVGLVGGAESMRSVFSLMERVARSDVTVVIYGEDGTGKELAAHAIHETGPRGSEPFIPVDCSALASGNVESELFGHAQGAFPGAHAEYEGLLRMAGKGTVFLDEIFKVSLEVQAKLLRALQDGAVRALGSVELKDFRARIIAAANQDLMEAVKEGRFREDLFYLLHILPIHMPPLRDRASDIPTLARHFLARHASSAYPARSISAEALATLEKYDWPGNVRQLENTIRSAMVLCDGPEIRLKHLPALISSKGLDFPSDLESPAGGLMGEAERIAVLKALEQTHGNKRQAARVLGVSKTTLYAKLRKFGITGSPSAM